MYLSTSVLRDWIGQLLLHNKSSQYLVTSNHSHVFGLRCLQLHCFSLGFSEGKGVETHSVSREKNYSLMAEGMGTAIMKAEELGQITPFVVGIK